MTVYIVHGPSYDDGHRVYGVFSDYGKAIEHAMRVYDCTHAIATYYVEEFTVL